MTDYISPNNEGLFAESDSLTIQNAIEEAVRKGCRKVVIPRFNLRREKAEWRIREAIRIPENFTLVLDNCYMVMETGVYDHMFTNSRSYATDNTAQNEQGGIVIRGIGNVCLDGGEHNRLLEKTSGKFGLPRVWKNTMFFWVNVNGLQVENLHIENQRWWAITHVACRNVKIKNIDFGAVPHVPNMDGIDLRIGCNNFEIENITGRTGDDVIAMTAIHGNELQWVPADKDTDIHDVKIRNVLGDPFIHFVIRLLNHDGSNIYNIDLDTVHDYSDFTTKKRPRCTIGIGNALYSKKRMSVMGETRDITARHLTSRGETAVRLDNTVCNSVFTDVKTFGDNITAVSTQGKGSTLHDVTFRDLYYGATQQEIFCSTELDPSAYHGAVVDLPKATGDLTVVGMHVDKVRTVASLYTDTHLTVEGYECTRSLTVCKLGEGSTLTIDGEEIKNG